MPSLRQLPVDPRTDIPLGTRFKYWVIRKFPYSSLVTYWVAWIRNRADTTMHYALIIIVPALFGLFCLHAGPNFYDVPSEVAGKVATVHIIQTILIIIGAWALIVQQVRRPIPRGRHF
ncbi:hypothetical protein D1BOALGB6SA_1046 [Olavius sp. associated proteobacterium Delta 1]|nr:hypothetical protein D1BOALGB6SA_1046 [Olavius sp. associated proteobacterium Delta 1]